MSIYAEHKPEGGGVFLKFENDRAYKLRLVTEPFIFKNSFTDPQTGEVNESFKYAWGGYLYDEDRAVVIQLPVTGYRQIAELAEDADWGDPTMYDIKVKRTGTGFDTKYSVIGNPQKTALTIEQKEKVANLDVPRVVKGAISLNEFVKAEKEKSPATPSATSVPTEPDGDPGPTAPPADEDINIDDIPF